MNYKRKLYFWSNFSYFKNKLLLLFSSYTTWYMITNPQFIIQPGCWTTFNNDFSLDAFTTGRNMGTLSFMLDESRINNLKRSLRFPWLGLNPIIDSIVLEDGSTLTEVRLTRREPFNSVDPTEMVRIFGEANRICLYGKIKGKSQMFSDVWTCQLSRYLMLQFMAKLSYDHRP